MWCCWISSDNDPCPSAKLGPRGLIGDFESGLTQTAGGPGFAEGQSLRVGGSYTCVWRIPIHAAVGV